MRALLRVVIAGHVDHGKSTLVGRLFHDTDSLPEGRLEAIKAMSQRRGMPFEWAFLMDAFQAERDQGITIDTSQIWFKTQKRDYTLIDAPGHAEFLKNMVTGATQAQAALLIVDAAEGVREQSRRHGYLLHLIGIHQIAVVVNKMDMVNYEEDQFSLIEEEYSHYLSTIGLSPMCFIPVSAREGDNIAQRSPRMPWYRGPLVLEALDNFTGEKPLDALPLRMPVQDIYKFDKRRIIAGRVETGQIRVGDEIIFSPSNKKGQVKSIESWPHKTQEAFGGQSIGITLTDQMFIERGEIISHAAEAPIESDVFRTRLFWLGKQPLPEKKQLKMKLASMESPVVVQSIEHVINTEDLSRVSAKEVGRNQVAEVVLRAPRLLALDEYESNPRTGRFVLTEGYDIAGGGIIFMEGYPDQRQIRMTPASNLVKTQHHITPKDRTKRNGHKGGVLWLTGLSGSGKSTLALTLEQRLFEQGFQVYVLDGDNVRHGLNANLGFSPEDRAENIRRVGEVAALFAHAGVLVITAFISPYTSDRARARAATKEGFHEVYLAADLETCEKRDTKGLYKKARAGEIPHFTGLTAPYEPPEEPELTLDTATLTVETCLDTLVAYAKRHFQG